MSIYDLINEDQFHFSRAIEAGVKKSTKYDNTINGRKGGEYIGGTNGNDKITSQQGNDNIYGFGGDDYIKAGLDKYKTCIDGGDGNDTILFGKNDAITGGKGADKFIPQSKSMGVWVISDFGRKEGDSLELKKLFSAKDKVVVEVLDDSVMKDYAVVWKVEKNGEWTQMFNFYGKKAVTQFEKDVKMRGDDNATKMDGKALIDYFMNEGKNATLTKSEYKNFNSMDVSGYDDAGAAHASSPSGLDYLL